MTGILGEIIEYKRTFVEDCKKRLPFRELEVLAGEAGKTRDFKGALSGRGCSLIAEITRATRRGGIVFGRGSEPVVEELRKARKLFTEVDVGSDSNDHFLFIKN